jgi:hypothetical protein
MNSTLATEATEKSITRSPLETWGKNERMRHIPPVEWLIEKVDGDLRRRIEKLYPSATRSASSETIEGELRALCRAIDRLADTAKFSRGANHAPSELGPRLTWALDHAVSCLRSLDANLFGRRYPFQTFERSKSELTYGALLVVIDHVHRLTTLIRLVDPQVDERLLEGLVSLKEPLRAEAIA